MAHRLIGTEVSLYTGKVRAYLRFKGIPFDEILSTREVYQSVIVPRTGVRYIPVLITDDDIAIQDSTEIIDVLEQRYPQPAVYPLTPLQRLVALLFEVYGDEWLLLPAMHYRWNVPENKAYAVQEFGRTSSPTASVAEQQRLGARLAEPFAGALPYLGITPRSAGAIEASYLAFLADFEQHLQHTPYLLGARPCIGDFGLIGPLYAHLYRDPASGALMAEKAPRVADWVERMMAVPEQVGDFLPEDQVPSTLVPLLARIFGEQVPVLLDTADRVARWAKEHSERELPRTLAKGTFTLGGVTEQRAVSAYPLWMWQRPQRHYCALSPEDRQRAQDFLAAIPGASAALARPVERPVERVNNRLRLQRE